MMNKNVPGISDDLFIRGKVPMTKEEIRVLSLSKMKINKSGNVLDIGAGTGSVSVEAALMSEEGKVFAVEKNKDAVELILSNIKKFEIENIKVIEGSAPESIPDEKFDSVFIGGSGGNMDLIFDEIYPKLNLKGRVVINATLIETFNEAVKNLEKHNFNDINYLQVQINRKRKLGSGNSFVPLNPVFIIWGEK